MTFKNGQFVADHMTATERMDDPVNSEQVQPNGVDITVKDIEMFEVAGKLSDGEYEKPETKSLREDAGTFSDGWYNLVQGSYLVRYNETVQIPDDCVGFVWPRSRLLRSGIHLTSAVWDAGYIGSGYGLLIVTVPNQLEDGMSIGQMVFAECEEPQELYEGQHQGENLADYIEG